MQIEEEADIQAIIDSVSSENFELSQPVFQKQWIKLRDEAFKSFSFKVE